MSEMVVRWGVRSSLRDYIHSLADGSAWTDGGAVALADGRFEFTGPEFDPAADSWRLVGSVHLRGHGGMLSLDVVDPCIEWAGNDAVLTVADLDDPPERTPFVQLVGLGRDLSVPAARAVSTHLTAIGAELFLGNYREGMAFDPVEIILNEGA